MSFHKPTLLQIAMHEAGHAYAFASILPGETSVELGIEPLDGGWHGWSKRLRVAETAGADLVRRMLGDDEALRWIATAEVAINLAGPLAEARQRERSSAAGLVFMGFVLPRLLDPAGPAIDTDFAHIRRMFANIGLEDTQAASQAFLIKTNALLDRCWPGVRRLGRRLTAERLIDEAGLIAHFAEWPATRN